MRQDMKPPNKDDEVYLKSLNMLGKVLRVRPGDVREPEEEKLYEVQIKQYFPRTDLELDDVGDN
jgi:hypothetical protein